MFHFSTKNKKKIKFSLFLFHNTMVQLQAFGYHFHFERKEMVKKLRYTNGANQVNANNNLQASTATVPCVVYNLQRLFFPFSFFLHLVHFIYVIVGSLALPMLMLAVGAIRSFFSHRKYGVNHCRSICRLENGMKIVYCALVLKDIWIYLL